MNPTTSILEEQFNTDPNGLPTFGSTAINQISPTFPLSHPSGGNLSQMQALFSTYFESQVSPVHWWTAIDILSERVQTSTSTLCFLLRECSDESNLVCFQLWQWDGTEVMPTRNLTWTDLWITSLITHQSQSWRHHHPFLVLFSHLNPIPWCHHTPHTHVIWCLKFVPLHPMPTCAMPPPSSSSSSPFLLF